MKLFDLHCDTLYECCETGRRLRENDLHVNRAAARKYRHYAQFFRPVLRGAGAFGDAGAGAGLPA